MEEDEGYYTEERWRNWVERLREEDIDPESEEGALLLFNLQDDVTIGMAKAIHDLDEGELTIDEFLEELGEIHSIVMQDVELSDEEKQMLLGGVQNSLLAVFASCETYATIDMDGGHDHDVSEVVDAAIEAEEEEDIETALGYIAHAGAHIIDGEDLDADSIQDEVEYGVVAEFINGLVSLNEAVKGPEIVEDD